MRADDKMATDELYVLRNYDLPQAKMAVKYTTEFIAAIDPYMSMLCFYMRKYPARPG
jgi:hypothetical protein